MSEDPPRPAAGPSRGPGATRQTARAQRAAGRDALVALVAGVLHTAAFAPLDAWWLQIAALALLAWRARSAAPLRAALLGWCFGVGWLASGLWWLFISLHRYGGLAAPLAALAVGLLAAALALYYALALAAYARWRSGRPGADAVLFAACWLAAELARASWFTGFPWLASGYAHTVGPLAAWAPWIGVYGIGALAAALAATLAALPAAWAAPGAAAERRPGAAGARLQGPGLTLLGVVVLGLALPSEFTTGSGRLAVSLVQPNVAQDLKFDPARIDANLEALARAVEGARGALIVTPESVVPLPFEAVDAAYWQRLQRALSGSGRAALVGVFLGDERSGYVNSMIGLSAARGVTGGAFYRYGKRHLLPFGEFIPPGFHWFVRALNIPLDDQASGHSSAPFEVDGQRLRPLICYEDLFGEDIVGSAVGSAVGADAATILVNASNLAWFGTLMVQDQHLQFSRMRALEFERPVVRATNTGATAVVDHRGAVTARLAPALAGTLEATVEGRRGATPYARWLAAAGLAPLWLLALGVIAAFALWRRR